MKDHKSQNTSKSHQASGSCLHWYWLHHRHGCDFAALSFVVFDVARRHNWQNKHRPKHRTHLGEGDGWWDSTWFKIRIIRWHLNHYDLEKLKFHCEVMSGADLCGMQMGWVCVWQLLDAADLSPSLYTLFVHLGRSYFLWFLNRKQYCMTCYVWFLFSCLFGYKVLTASFASKVRWGESACDE